MAPPYVSPPPHTCLSPSQGRGCVVPMSENPLHMDVSVNSLCHRGHPARPFRKIILREGKALVQGPQSRRRESWVSCLPGGAQREGAGRPVLICTMGVFGLLEPAGRPGASLSRLPRPRLYCGQRLPPAAVCSEPRKCHSSTCGGSPLLPKAGSDGMVGKWAEAAQGRGKGPGPASQSLPSSSRRVVWPRLPPPPLSPPASSTPLPTVPCASRHLHLLVLSPREPFQSTSV